MKTLVGILLAVSIFAGLARAIDTEYKTRVISGATLTINVKDGQYLTIRNFTQTGTATQRGAVTAGIFPTPAPTATPTPTTTPPPTPTPTSTDLTATKTDNVGGQATFPNQWTWTIHVADGGNTAGSFTSGETILSDNLPNSSITYGLPTINNPIGVTNSSSIICSISSGNDLTCAASGDTVTINAGGSFDVKFTATANATGTYSNPRSGGGCSVDPDNVVSESDESNNTCADTVVISAPTPTPTPILGKVLTASITGASPAEFIKPVYIAGPAIVTVNPVPDATLTITYRKFVQPGGTPTPTPSPTVTTTTITTSTPTPTGAAGVSSTSSMSVVATALGPSDDDDDSDSSTPTPTPTPIPTSIPSITPTPSPTPTPSH